MGNPNKLELEEILEFAKSANKWEQRESDLSSSYAHYYTASIKMRDDKINLQLRKNLFNYSLYIKQSGMILGSYSGRAKEVKSLFKKAERKYYEKEEREKEERERNRQEMISRAKKYLSRTE